MISSHKSSSYKTNNNNNNHLIQSVNKCDRVETATEIATQSTNLIVIPNDDELPVAATSTPVASIVTASESNNVTVTDDTMKQSSIFSGTIINPLIAKNPNLMYKSNADDIMNMDIIFDNVPIEEDTSIANNVTIIHETTTTEIPADDIQYEIIDLNGSNQTDSVIQHQMADTNYTQMDDSSNDGILVIDETVHTEYNEIVIDSNEVVIVTSPSVPSSPKNDVVVAFADDQTITDENICSEAIETNLSPIASNMIDSTPKESEVVKTKKTRIRQPKVLPLKEKVASKQKKSSNKTVDHSKSATTSNRSSNSKRKPLRIDRGKKSKVEESQPLNKSEIHIENDSKLTIECEKVAEEVAGNVAEKVAEKIAEKVAEKVADTSTPEPSTSAQFYEQEAHHDSVDETTDDVNNESNESEANNFMDSLVVVESQDPNDSSKTIHEVFVVCPKTKTISDQPLDLPDEVIQRIRLSMLPGTE